MLAELRQDNPELDEAIALAEEFAALSEGASRSASIPGCSGRSMAPWYHCDSSPSACRLITRR